MIALVVVGGVFALIAGYHILKVVLRLSLETETKRITKENQRKLAILGSIEKPIYLPKEEDVIDYSEETSEIRGIECSAVMDEEDKETEND